MDPGIAIIFAKPPHGGHAKTRLAERLGRERAGKLAAAFLMDTFATLTAWGRAEVRLATPEPMVDHGVRAEAWPQGGGDLGARIERVCRRALAGAPWVLALGADAPGIPLTHLDASWRALHTADAVIGPSRDGGFWVLGLRTCPEGLLGGLPWSAPSTHDATAARLRARMGDVASAPPWFDLDEPTDLDHFRAHVPRSAAPRTWAALEAC